MSHKVNTNITVDEARLLAVHRAIERFSDDRLVPAEDVGTLALYANVLLNLPELENKVSEDQIEFLLNGFVAGFAANRLVSAGLQPSPQEEQNRIIEDEESVPTRGQTGVDPSGKVRNPS